MFCVFKKAPDEVNAQLERFLDHSATKASIGCSAAAKL